jgi:hypothetical protein
MVSKRTVSTLYECFASSPSRVSVYYGWSHTGQRIHLGEKVHYIREGKLKDGRRIAVVGGFCGTDVRAYTDRAMPPPHLAREFCRNCMRPLAFDVLIQRADEIAKQIESGSLDWQDEFAQKHYQNGHESSE